MIEQIKNTPDLDASAMKVRETLGVYMPVQVKVMDEMYRGHENARLHGESWRQLYSPEFEELFLIEVKKILEAHPELADDIKIKDELSPHEIELKIEALNKMERILMNRIKPQIDFKGGFVEWHEANYKKILRVIHKHPDFVDAFSGKEKSVKEREEIISLIKSEMQDEDLQEAA